MQKTVEERNGFSEGGHQRKPCFNKKKKNNTVNIDMIK